MQDNFEMFVVKFIDHLGGIRENGSVENEGAVFGVPA
jgi:hypothetical protein